MSTKRGLIFLVSMFALLVSVSLVSAQSEGIPLQKDVILNVPILAPEDLPEEVTFTLYGAQNGLTPLGAQTFTRGQYTVDFEFSQSDGVTGGSVARVKAEFTNNLNLKDDFGEPVKPTELWAALEVAGAEVGPRSKVSDETLVRLLLNSDASLATYLTLAYEGDENPITSIYKDLPMSFVSSDGTKRSLSDYFSGVVASTAIGDKGEGALIDPNNWFNYSGNIYYNYGNVGIGTANPARKLHLKESAGAHAGFMVEATGVGDNSYFIFKVPGYQTYLGYDATNELIKLNNATALTSVNHLVVNKSGKVGIGTKTINYNLAVNGTIGCKELTVTSTGWSDFVFQDNYKLPSLEEVDAFIQERRHLPGIPTEAEVKEKGVNVAEISTKLLQKIEELTLYVIDISKENASLKVQLANLEAQLKEIKN